MAERVPLADMVEACDEQLMSWENTLDRYAKEHPDNPLPPTHPWVKQARTFKALLGVLKFMASYEDRSREFVSQLMKDYSEGRWP